MTSQPVDGGRVEAVSREEFSRVGVRVDIALKEESATVRVLGAELEVVRDHQDRDPVGLQTL